MTTALLSALICTSTLAQSSRPNISTAYPPTEDIRTPDLIIPVGHGLVTSVTYTTDGRSLATVTGDGVTRLWEARPGEQGTGALIRELKAPHEVVLSAPSAISRDFGHNAEPFERADILRFYLDGIQWVLGDLPTD